MVVKAGTAEATINRAVTANDTTMRFIRNLLSRGGVNTPHC
jgi:hypothetical protein